MNKKQRWIIDNIPEIGVDILNQEFVDAFIKEFNPPYIATMWGAHKVPSLNRLLKQMYKEGFLSRCIVGLCGTWQPGFPKWVHVYSLSSAWRRHDLG